MGSGIAQVSATAGYDVMVLEQEQKFLDKGFAGIEKSLAKFAEKGTIKEPAGTVRARIKGTTDRGALAESMLRLLRDPSLRAELGARGIERARLYPWDRSARLMTGLLAEAAR